MEDKAIIKSWIDNDFYDYTQGDMIHQHHPNVPVELSFINRTRSVRLAEMIDPGELKEQLRAHQTLGFRPGELHFILGTYEYGQPMFRFEYGEFLRNLKQLPDFSLEVVDGQFDLRFYGPASEVIYWEIPSMIIIKKLYLNALMKGFSRFEREVVEAEGLLRLAETISILGEDPDINFADFGTRRRYSFEHQRDVVGVLKEELPRQFKGTSNVLLAKEHEVVPIGTNSHKMSMIYMGIHWDRDNLDPTFSQRQMLKDWEDRHGLALSVFLPDTWNSEWFFKNVVTVEQLRRWKGSRQDSGIPFNFAENRIRGYKEIGVDPCSKTVMFTDNLNARKVREISSAVKGKIGYTFGIGTQLTDNTRFPRISIVTKVSRSNGHDIAKLSDNISKACGTEEAVLRAMMLTGCKPTFTAACES